MLWNRECICTVANISCSLRHTIIPCGNPRGRGGLDPNLVPCLNKRINERTLNSVFRVKTTLVWETAPFHCLTDFDSMNNDCFFHYNLKNPILFHNICIFLTLIEDSAAHCPALKKYPFSSFSCSIIGTKLASKHPPRVGNAHASILRIISLFILDFDNFRIHTRICIRAYGFLALNSFLYIRGQFKKTAKQELRLKFFLKWKVYSYSVS